MNITEVRVKAVQSRNGKLKGWASVTFDNAFVVHNMKIIQGKKGKFVAMPNRKTKEGGYKDIAHPINNETRKSIEDSILEEYEKVAEAGDFATEDEGYPEDDSSSISESRPVLESDSINELNSNTSSFESL